MTQRTDPIPDEAKAAAKHLDAVVARINRLDDHRKTLLAERADCFRELLALGVRQAVIARRAGVSNNIVNWSAKGVTDRSHGTRKVTA